MIIFLSFRGLQWTFFAHCKTDAKDYDCLWFKNQSFSIRLSMSIVRLYLRPDAIQKCFIGFFICFFTQNFFE